MFSWICPKCGSEVPPSYDECPNCASSVAASSQPAPAQVRHAAPPPPPPQPGARPSRPQTVTPPPPQESRRPPKPAGILFGGGDYEHASGPPPEYQPPPNYPPPPQQSYAPPAQSYLPPQRGSGLPSWALMLLVAVLVGGVVAGAVWLKRRSSEAPVTEASVPSGESAPAAAGAGHRYAKFVEISGFRLSEDSRQRANIKMAVTNHSTADIGDLEMMVTLKTTDGKDIGAVQVKVNGLGPLASTEVTAPLKTKMRAYELPDWQFIRAEFQITSQ